MTRRRAIIAGAALAALLVAFLAGRLSTPQRVVTKDVVRTQTVQVEKVRTVTVHDVVQAKAEEAKVRTVTVTKWRWLPGGVVEADATTTKQADTEAHTSRSSSSVEEAKREVDVRQTVVTLHTVTPVRPRWSVSLLPGAQLFGSKAVTLFGPLVLGASVEHRFIGPVRLGIWGSTSGSVGITLGGDI